MKNICIATTTRADYGLLLPVIKELEKQNKVNYKLVVTGTHLSNSFGKTIKEIENDKIKIDRKISILDESGNACSTSKTMSNAIEKFSTYFHSTKPNALLVLGDRYETLAICCAALNEQIPIFHMCGGETTEGAIDEAVRHSITKMSYLHFVTTEEYKKRVIQLGENPNRVFNVGATSAENVLKMKLLSKEETLNELGINHNQKYAIATFHPVTLDDGFGKKQINELLSAIDEFKDIKFIFTKSNADAGGQYINKILEKTSKHKSNVMLVDSLGIKRYLSAIKYSQFVIGNSSSGIAEAPLLKVPTINIGDRQKGRLKANSIIDCKPKKEDIVSSINKAISKEFKEIAKNAKSPYRKANTSKNIASLIDKYLNDKKINIKKAFYDIDF